MFEHNKPGQGLDISLQIMTVAGRVIKTINQSITPEGNRVEGPEWDGRDEFGDKLGRGVYIYRLRVKTQDGKKKEVLEKLVIL
jgi:flagellar hook assembly protein FlgD